MSEIVLSKFKNAWVPATWLSAKCTIRTIDNTVVVNAEAMTEIWNWRYSYVFQDYDKKKIYLVDTDWWPTLVNTDRYQDNTNELDAYPNKQDFWKMGWAVFKGWANVQEIAQEVWRVKTENLIKHDWTVWKHVSELDTKKVLDKIDEIQIPDNTKEISEIKENIGVIVWDIWNAIEKSVGSINTQLNEKSSEIKQNIKAESLKTATKIEDNKKEIVEKIENKEITKIDYEKIDNTIKKNKTDVSWIETKLDTVLLNEQNVIDWMKSEIISFKTILETKAPKVVIEKEVLSKEYMDIIIKKITEIWTISTKEFENVNKNITDIEDTIKKIDEQDTISDDMKQQKKELNRQYMELMKFITYTAKNIWLLANKNDVKTLITLLKKK